MQSDEVPLVDRLWFSMAIGVVACVNVVTIGFETDLRQGSWPSYFAAINTVFLIAYIAELVLRLLVHGIAALGDRFTVLDGVLVLVAFVERVATNSGFARALPAFRLLKLLKLLREQQLLRTSMHLRVLFAIASRALSALGWVSLLLLTVLWASASFTKYVIGDSAQWVGSMDTTVYHEPFASFDNHEYFGSVSRSFLTLLQIVTLSQWGDQVARPVFLVYPYLLFFFVSFIFATSYGLVLCLIANVTQDSMAEARLAEEVQLEIYRDGRRIVGDRVWEILRLVDADHDGQISAKEMDEALKMPELKQLLQSLNVPLMNGEFLVLLFDKNSNNSITVDELVGGLVVLDDEIATHDYTRLAMRSRNLLLRAQAMSAKAEKLAAQVVTLRQTMEKAFRAAEYFRDTRESTELRGKAIQAIRRLPPGEAPHLQGWKPPPVPKYPPGDPALYFMNFTRRTFGGISQDLETEEGLRRAAQAKRKLPAAPPRFEISRAEALEADKDFEDKYDLVRTTSRHQLPGPNPSLVRLRELIG